VVSRQDHFFQSQGFRNKLSNNSSQAVHLTHKPRLMQPIFGGNRTLFQKPTTYPITLHQN
jgi:hypothetical protein